MYLIYKHTCKINGKSYIGKTANINNPNKRWKNGFGYTEATQPAFYKAIQKYGWENFTHEILENYIQTAEEANQREQYWIAYYHTWVYDPECNGYNITMGGKGNTGHKLSEETKQKLREARYSQKNLSLDHNTGKICYNNGIVNKLCFPGTEPEGFIKGKLINEEVHKKMSEAQSKHNKARKGKLQKICVVKDGIIKCIGKKNLYKYLADGWVVYINGSGGKWGIVVEDGSK